ncbi:MAG: hypothetical protein IRY97_00535, partial [Thermomicrobiaceae bacterium]|nr:hypothetical protein [Thermomicrobiaceae bacterium]
METNRQPTIFLLGVSHRTAPLALRERLAFAPEERAALLRDLAEVVDEAAAIVTCNRTEVYGVAADPSARERALALL